MCLSFPDVICGLFTAWIHEQIASAVPDLSVSGFQMSVASLSFVAVTLHKIKSCVLSFLTNTTQTNKSPPLRSFQVSFFLSENTHIDLLSDRMCHSCELIITAVCVTACLRLNALRPIRALRPSRCTSNWFNRQRLHHMNDEQLPAADTAHYTVLISAVPPCQFVWVFLFFNV